jgi:phosphoribosyl-AMP cyclohydrolase
MQFIIVEGIGAQHMMPFVVARLWRAYRRCNPACLYFVTEIEMSDRENGSLLDPKWDANGLITAIVTDADSGDVLMLAHMNAQALDLTLSTRVAHFWSRSRRALWKKGESSGHYLDVAEVRIDCDQDALWLRCTPQGPSCHTGEKSCFYRKIENGALVRI